MFGFMNEKTFCEVEITDVRGMTEHFIAMKCTLVLVAVAFVSYIPWLFAG